ncbi:hypothetical protein ABGB12_24775 [Actinocorallia sp. B10E7]|uniref:hypothetical protein n=1 Tax=Actinocorallia sp. B10E7 TaxID=3153558 RepID=UPI00325F8B97
MQQENEGAGNGTPVEGRTGPQAVFAEPTQSGAHPVVQEPEDPAEPSIGTPVAGAFDRGTEERDNGQEGTPGSVAPVPPAPVPAAPSGGSRGEDADFGGLDDGPGVARYAGVDLSGPAEPPKAGIPSSGNWQMPEWMREETEANRAASAETGGGFDEQEMRKDRSRTFLFAGLGALAVVGVVALGIFVVKGNGDSGEAEVKARPGITTPSTGQTGQAEPPPRKKLMTFKGGGSPVTGVLADPNSGLSVPQLGGGWVEPTKKNKLAQSGWSGQQILVTEKKGTQLWYGTVLTSPLGPVERRIWAKGGDLEQNAAAVASSLEDRLYGFPHKTSELASQPLKAGGRDGWLVARYLKYDRAPVRSTAEVVVTVLVDTGKQYPSVLFVSMPNTHKTLWPDINTVISQLKAG